MNKNIIKSITTYSVLSVILAAICYFTLDTSVNVETEENEIGVENVLSEDSTESTSSEFENSEESVVQ